MCEVVGWLFIRTEYILEGLHKYTVYKVCVAGVTVAGVGNFSEVVESRTLSDRKWRQAESRT